jgi:chitinase
MATAMLTLMGGLPPVAVRGVTARAEGALQTGVYVYDGSKAKYRDDDAMYIDQMFYAFALFRSGRLSVSHWKNFKKYQAYIKKHPNIMPILSIGGWGADGFSQAAATAEGRAAFTEDVLQIMEKYGFLGADIDWEYPGSSVAGIESSPADRENFTLLLAALRAGLDELTAKDGKPRRLCIALSGSPEIIENLQCVEIGEIIDQVNLMTYDQQLPDVASHHSALFASQPSAPSAAASAQAYIDAGIPAAKLMLGVAFYGHRWSTREADPLYRTANYQGTLAYSAIAKLIRKKPDAVRFDETAQASYYVSGKTFISYDDERSIQSKAGYASDIGLMGVFAWEYGALADGSLVAAMRLP